MRNTPLLVQLYFVFYVLPFIGLTFDALATGIVGLGLNYSAYIAEVYRAGIEGVAAGQWEASTALGFSARHTWTRIVLPQAIPPNAVAFTPDGKAVVTGHDNHICYITPLTATKP